MHRVIAVALVLSCFSGCAKPPEPADLVLTKGTIVTMDPEHPRVEALAATKGRIVAVGSDEEIRKLAGPQARVVDLKGMFAVPGLIEGHGHLTGLGRARKTLDVSGAKTWDEVVERVRQAASTAAPGAWILGWGWHQEKWDAPPRPAVEGYPVHA